MYHLSPTERHHHPAPALGTRVSGLLRKHKVVLGVLVFVVLVVVLTTSIVVGTNGNDNSGSASSGTKTPSPTGVPTIYHPPTTAPTVKPTTLCSAGLKPNIITILSDDQGYGDRQRYNGHILDMPNLERLSSNGMEFMDGHSMSGVCSPSRYALLTGQYAFRKWRGGGALGAAASPKITETTYTIPRLLKNAGYKSYMSGKWHIGMDMPSDLETGEIYGGPIDAGFDRFFGIPASLDYGWLSYIHNKTFSVPPTYRTDRSTSSAYRIQSCPTTVDGCSTWGMKYCSNAKMRQTYTCSSLGWYWKEGISGGERIAPDFDLHWILRNITHAGLGFIDDHIGNYGKDTPFYLHMTLNSPHLPHVPHPDFAGKNKASYGAYADFLEETDYRVGEVLDKLEEHGILNNTLLIYTSDNGPEGKSKFVNTGLDSTANYKGDKRSLYEGGNRVPFLVHWPDVIAPGTESSFYVSQVDLLATFADMLGLEKPSDEAKDSFSFWKGICDADGATFDDIRDKQPMINEKPNKGILPYSIRCGHFKLYEYSSWFLYNITADPYETTNLVKTESKIFEDLKTLLYYITTKSPEEHDSSTAICDQYLY